MDPLRILVEIASFSPLVRDLDQQIRNLVLAKDVLFAVGALTGLASVIQGRALTGQAPEGAVPIESGTTPAETTPEGAAGLLRSRPTSGIST